MIEDGKSGFLLSRHSRLDEVASVLKRIGFFKKREVRENAYKIFLEHYNAKENYSQFVSWLQGSI